MLVLGGLVAGCDEGEGPQGPCGGAPCEIPESRDELLAELEGFSDPMAEALRALADEDGRVPADWKAVAGALGDAVGCDDSTESSYVVLSNEALQPKGLVTRCSDSPTDGSRFFMVLEPGEGDLDGEAFRVAAWDADHEQYRRYQMVPAPSDDRLGVSVEPTFCAGCHGGPAGRTDWAPIMNEMTEPWAQWNAEPGFSSFMFDEHFPPDSRGPVFDEIAQESRLDSASNLEPLIRAALDRVSGARIKSREAAADLDAAANLLRPVFCDEAANFVSEIHRSSEIHLDAALDPGLRDGFAALEAANWPWVTDTSMLVGDVPEDEDPIALVAVRGRIGVGAESSLRSRGVLSPEQLLRVRVLDWMHPFGSPVRCSLFEDAMARAEDGAGVDASQYEDNAALVAALFADAMTIDGRTLLTDDPERLVALADAIDADELAALQAGDFDALAVTLDELGEQIATHIESLDGPEGRAWLAAERDRRGCIARRQFPTAPLIPGLPTCD